jgi:putative flavoprotein involved in K+ transport
MHECLIIGAGQFGIACAYKLKRAGVDALVVDADARVGDVWRRRPRRLQLFTPRCYSAICGIAMPGDPDGYPSGGEFADYLDAVARQCGVEVASSKQVVHLARSDDHEGPEAGFIARFADGGSVRARTVVNASGANQAQKVPDFASRLEASVRQIAAGEYRDPDDLAADATVCIVGDGASGRQIALELAESGRRVVLARGRRRKMLPNRLLGRHLFWWLTASGLAYADRDSAVARILRKRDPIPTATCRDDILAARGVRLVARATDADGRRILFADGSAVDADVVIWSGGYRERMDWLTLPAIRTESDLYDGRGCTPEPGFYVLGRRWLSCRGSELVLGVERDAGRIAAAVHAHLRAPAAALSVEKTRR